MRAGLILAGSLVVAGCTAVEAQSSSKSLSTSVPKFEFVEAIEAFAEEVAKSQRAQRREMENSISVTGAVLESAAVVPEADGASTDITNNQEAGVDEGGLVKATKDFLVVLRRGRIFTIRHGDNALSPTDSINAFAPGDDNPGDTWYDEMLVDGNTIITIGYSYGNSGTEISRFKLAADGSLSYQDTHYLTSADYYSSRNYASRLIDGQLVMYAPIPMNWGDWRTSLPSVRKRMDSATIGEERKTVTATQLHIPDHLRENPSWETSILHSVTSCDMRSEKLECESTAVVGSWSRNFYITGDAVYVWTSGAGIGGETEARDLLYRVPLELDNVQAVSVSGYPVDQFSFKEDAETDNLFVVVRGQGFGGAMWGGEFSGGTTALLRLPMNTFGDGSQAAPMSRYQQLASPRGYRFQNRFVGRHLLYAASDWRDEGKSNAVYVAPLDARWVERITLPHGVTRLDAIGPDAIAIGPNGEGELGFSSVLLAKGSGASRLGSTEMMGAAREGENRSHAFFFRPNRSGEPGDGMMALPVQLELDDDRYEFLGSASAMTFVGRKNQKLSQMGMVNASYDTARPDGCQASCVDWYGNARPIFLGNRILALMGYELIEGTVDDGAITEMRRVDFAPQE
ncbi:beta-propeller domain-containing protein [Erythrobacter sp. W53]|uniref:beta-propeller domain-containing protein n=1 Tax=Erythrobacter sp. W53 TaxID=3425947 RepID=UPI003D7685A7